MTLSGYLRPLTLWVVVPCFMLAADDLVGCPGVRTSSGITMTAGSNPCQTTYGFRYTEATRVDGTCTAPDQRLNWIEWVWGWSPMTGLGDSLGVVYNSGCSGGGRCGLGGNAGNSFSSYDSDNDGRAGLYWPARIKAMANSFGGVIGVQAAASNCVYGGCMPGTQPELDLFVYDPDNCPLPVLPEANPPIICPRPPPGTVGASAPLGVPVPPGSGEAGGDGPLDAPSPSAAGQQSSDMSFVDHLSGTHIHDATDYAVEAPDACVSCSGGAGAGPGVTVPMLSLKRFHRYQDIDRPSSLGPGVFLSYDISLRAVSNGTVTRYSVFDPRGTAAIEYVDPNQSGTANAERGPEYGSLVIRSSTNQVIGNLAQARFAELTLRSGWTLRFDIIRTHGDPLVSDRSGRLTHMADPHGNTLVVEYVVAADASDAVLGGDRERLWRINRIVDATGTSAGFVYRSTPHAGRWVVQQINLPTGYVLVYDYDDMTAGKITAQGSSALVGATRIQLPDGAVSTVTGGVDSEGVAIQRPAMQGVGGFQPVTRVYRSTLAITYNEAAATGIHRRKTAYLSYALNHRPLLGVFGAVQSGRLRRVVSNGLPRYKNAISYQDLGNGTRRVTVIVYEGSAVRRVTYIQAMGGNAVAAPESLAILGRDVPDKQWTVTAVDAYGRVTGLRDAADNLWQYAYDVGTGRLTSVTYPDGKMWTRSVNVFGQTLTETDRYGRTTTMTYTVDGSILTRTEGSGTPDVGSWTWGYGAAGSNAKPGQPTSLTDPRGMVTSYVYTPAGRLEAIVEPKDDPSDPIVPTRSFVYDAAGRVSRMVDQGGIATLFDYDPRNRLISTGYADATTEQIGYGTGSFDANLQVWAKDRNGAYTVFQYDEGGRRVAVYSGLTLIAGHAPSADLVHFSNVASAGVETTTYLDASQRPKRVTVNGQTTRYDYDIRGRIRSVLQEGSGSEMQYAYDGSDRVTMQAHYNVGGTAASALQRFWYDANGREIKRTDDAVGSASAATPTRLGGGNPPYVLNETLYDQPLSLVGSDSRYDGHINEVRVLIDGNGSRTVLGFDARRRLVVMIEASGTSLARKTVHAYDASGNRIQTWHPRHHAEAGGFTTTWTYTPRNLVRDRVEAYGRSESTTTRTTWTPSQRVQSVTVGYGTVDAATTLYGYGSCCDRLTSITDPAGKVTAFTYDGNGNRTRTTNHLNESVVVAYDARNRPISRSDARSKTSTYVYDDNLNDAVGVDGTYSGIGAGISAGHRAFGVEVTDPMGRKSAHVFDWLGRLVRTRDPNGNQSTLIRDTSWGSYPADIQTDGIGMPTTFVRDHRGLPLRTVNCLGQTVVSMTYDANGNRLSEMDASSIGWTATYDALNRMTGQTGTGTPAATRTFVYDLANNLVSDIDAYAHATTHAYDGLNRRTKTIDRVAGITEFAFDHRSNLLSITDAEVGRTAYTYDPRNLLLSESFPSPSGGTRTYTYDDAGRLKTRLDQSGVTTTYLYDANGRLTTRQYSGGTASDAYVYDDVGRLVSADSGRYGTRVERDYDLAGRLLVERQILDGTAYAVGSSYDVSNRRTTLRYPDNRELAVTYDLTNWIRRITFAGNTYLDRSQTSDYTLAGRPLTTRLGNGLVETRVWQTTGAVGGISVTGDGLLLDYTYDLNRRKLQEADGLNAAHTQTFGYDVADRLTSWTRGVTAATQSWTLSKVGDWQQTTVDGVVETRTHSPVHEVTGVTRGAATTSITYDPKGNMEMGLPYADGSVRRYVWDAENRLAAAWVAEPAVGATDTARYRYDALGRRVARTVYGYTTYYIHDGARVIHEVTQPQLLPATAADDDGPANAASGRPPGASWVGGGGILPNPLMRVNFQPLRSAIPEGFVADKGKVYAVRSNQLSYGWVATQDTAVVRNQFAVPQFDTHIRMWPTTQGATGTWEYALPNGTYPVVVVCGDPVSVDQTNHIRIEGVDCTDEDPALATPGYNRGDFDGWLEVVTVSDGKLSISGRAGAKDPKICFVEIGTKDQPVTQAMRDHLAEVILNATNLTASTGYPIDRTQMKQYVHGSYVDEVLGYVTTSAGVTNRYVVHGNHLYSPYAVTDSTGAVVERYRYDAYGTRTVTTAGGTVLPKSTIGFQRGFTGYQLDEETGLYYARKRMYSPGLGRFISRDPAGYVDGKSLYSGYMVPNYLDPFGLNKRSTNGEMLCEGPAKAKDDAGNECDPADMQDIEARVYKPVAPVREQMTKIILGGRATFDLWQRGGMTAVNPNGGSGHTFLVLPNEAVGLYPGADGFYGKGPGIIQPDDTSHWTHNKKYKVCPETLKKMQDKIAADKLNPPIYNLFGTQCTTWVLDVLMVAGINQPNGAPDLAGGWKPEPYDLASGPGFTEKPKP